MKYTLEDAQGILCRHRAAIRVIPKKIRHVFEVSHKAQYPEGKIQTLAGYGRQMLVVEQAPKHAGKICIGHADGTDAKVSFDPQFFDTMDDALDYIVKHYEMLD